MEETQAIIFSNLFATLRSNNFGTDETLIPMSPWKQKQMERYLDVANLCPTPFDRNTTYHLVNPMQEKRRERIFDEERHAIDTSVETLHLLNLIIYNAHCIDTTGLSVSGIVLIGKYLRERGHLADYVKLDSWLKRIYLRNIASLISSALLYIFNFEADELPFLYRQYPEIEDILCKQILDTLATGKQNRTSTWRYSPLSSIGIMTQKMRTSLANIEE